MKRSNKKLFSTKMKILWFIPALAFSKNPSCPDLKNWVGGTKVKDYLCKPNGVKVKKYVINTSKKVYANEIDSQCQADYGGYVHSATIMDDMINNAIYQGLPNEEYWFNMILSGDTPCEPYACWQQWSWCKNAGSDCTYNSNIRGTTHHWPDRGDDTFNNCQGFDYTNGKHQCSCWKNKVQMKPAGATWFPCKDADGCVPAYTYNKKGKSVWTCDDDKGATGLNTKRYALCEVLCGDDGYQYEDNCVNAWP